MINGREGKACEPWTAWRFPAVGSGSEERESRAAAGWRRAGTPAPGTVLKADPDGMSWKGESGRAWLRERKPGRCGKGGRPPDPLQREGAAWEGRKSACS